MSLLEGKNVKCQVKKRGYVKRESQLKGAILFKFAFFENVFFLKD